MQDQPTQGQDSRSGPRYVVAPGPPTWIVVDTQAGQRVGYFPFEAQSDAIRAAAKLNRGHANHPTTY